MSASRDGDPVVFLDRDGVINRRIIGDYVTRPEELEVLDGVPQAIASLQRAGYRLAVVTNQRGIAIGRMTRRDVDGVHEYLNQVLASAKIQLHEFYLCPHDRDEGCLCRKPGAGLLDQAAAFRPVDWRRSFLVGDSDTDIAAGLARGVTTIKVAGPAGDPRPRHVAADLPKAVSWILANPLR